ncbi:hypothetical protein D7W81_27605 [Corallococcus aberystwythensis]|uniref:Uncharacterized protein n=1 Tax=Corallococcus aberystwythensis TaxID=2316722 RepID=A0A3A8PW56_9BACT|nr:hypothetical protein D7W81_27605 [Corallococcus aberystwythensis]
MGPALDPDGALSPEAQSGGFESRRLQHEEPSKLKGFGLGLPFVRIADTEHRLRPLPECFAQRVCEQPIFRESFGLF